MMIVGAMARVLARAAAVAVSDRIRSSRRDSSNSGMAALTIARAAAATAVAGAVAILGEAVTTTVCRTFSNDSISKNSNCNNSSSSNNSSRISS